MDGNDIPVAVGINDTSVGFAAVLLDRDLKYIEAKIHIPTFSLSAAHLSLRI